MDFQHKKILKMKHKKILNQIILNNLAIFHIIH